MPTDFLTLTRTAGAPWRPYRRDADAQPCLLPDSIVLPGEDTPLIDDLRHEPALVAVPFLVEFEELDRLDPQRGEVSPDEPVASAASQARPIRGPLGSLLIHLLVLAAILAPGFTAPDLPKPIPISLVLQPPPAPKPAPTPKPPQPETVRPKGPLSSEDEGNVTPKNGQAATAVKRSAAPKRAPQPKLVPPPPKPALPEDDSALLQLPSIPAPVLVPPPAKTPTPDAEHQEPHPHAAGRMARVPGPAATKDQYLAYLVALTKQHFDLLPMSLIANRRGETQLSVVVLADGRIARIAIEQGSGYPDIDARVERMVAAVGRFPPLPQWYQRESMELIFTLRFPQGLARR